MHSGIGWQAGLKLRLYRRLLSPLRGLRSDPTENCWILTGRRMTWAPCLSALKIRDQIQPPESRSVVVPTDYMGEWR